MRTTIMTTAILPPRSVAWRREGYSELVIFVGGKRVCIVLLLSVIMTRYWLVHFIQFAVSYCLGYRVNLPLIIFGYNTGDGVQMPGNRCSNCIAYNYECSYIEAAKVRPNPRSYRTLVNNLLRNEDHPKGMQLRSIRRHLSDHQPDEQLRWESGEQSGETW